MKRLLVYWLIFSTVTTLAQAQQIVTGQILARATGMPVSGAGIRLRDASAGSVTDDKGRFSLSVPATATQDSLLVSHLGYQSVLVPMAQVGTVQLDEQVYQIGEVTITYVDLRKLLVKKWKVDDASIPDVAERTLATIQQHDPAKYEKLAKRPDTMNEIVKLVRLVFSDDGTARIKALLFFGQRFDWQLDQANRTVVLIDKEGHERKQMVSELTENRLVLKSIRTNGTTSEISYVAVK